MAHWTTKKTFKSSPVRAYIISQYLTLHFIKSVDFKWINSFSKRIEFYISGDSCTFFGIARNELMLNKQKYALDSKMFRWKLNAFVVAVNLVNVFHIFARIFFSVVVEFFYDISLVCFICIIYLVVHLLNTCTTLLFRSFSFRVVCVRACVRRFFTIVHKTIG